MRQGKRWLPLSTLQGPSVARPFGAVVAAWSSDWILNGAWQAEGQFVPVATEDDWAVIRDDVDFALGARPHAMLQLAFAILGQPVRNDLRPVDRQLLRQLANTALDNLLARVGALFSAASRDVGRDDPEELFHLGIGPTGGVCLDIRVGRPAMVARARAEYLPCRVGPRLAKPRSAVARQHVTIEAHLGSATLSRSQVETFEVGDILLLDRPVDAPVAISVNAQLGTADFTLDYKGHSAKLTLQE